MSDWISVKDRLPKDGEIVDIFSKDGDRATDYMLTCMDEVRGGEVTLWIHCTEDGDSIYLMNNITHWMPLPKPPKELK